MPEYVGWNPSIAGSPRRDLTLEQEQAARLLQTVMMIGEILMKLYTGRGDTGATDLLGERVRKTDSRIETLGALDEASSAMGLARAAARQERTRAALLAAQRDLYTIMSGLAFTTEDFPDRVVLAPARTAWLEQTTDELAAETPVAREFVVPGETPAGAALDWARVTVRRAERRLAHEAETGGVRDQEAPRYLNRLSSMLFGLARWEEHQGGVSPTLAKTGEPAPN